MIKIDEEIIKQATKCNKQFACVENREHVCCKVKHFLQDNICFVDGKQWQNCNYHFDFGYSDVCNCPVRTEIYKKYKI